MTVEIVPTAGIVTLNGLRLRIWEGTTAAGVPVALAIAHIGWALEDDIPVETDLPWPTPATMDMIKVPVRYEPIFPVDP